MPDACHASSNENIGLLHHVVFADAWLEFIRKRSSLLHTWLNSISRYAIGNNYVSPSVRLCQCLCDCGCVCAYLSFDSFCFCFFICCYLSEYEFVSILLFSSISLSVQSSLFQQHIMASRIEEVPVVAFRNRHHTPLSYAITIGHHNRPSP